MKVLLVDDDPDLRRTLGDILKAKGFETVPVETGAAALARIEPQDIDAALIDLKLEDMSGMDVLRAIKQHSADTECILLTGYASQATAIEAINLGAYAYFQKPYDMDQLLVAIQRAAEKRAAGEALKKSEERYRMLAENMSDTVWLMDMNLKNVYISPSVVKLRGYTLEELNELPFDQQMTPESLARAMQVFADGLSPERLAQRDQPITITANLEFYNKDGSTFWSENTFVLIRDANGAPMNILGVGRDITERKQAEEELYALSTRQEALLAAVPDILMEVDQEKVYTWANPAGVGFFGEDVIGKEAAFYFEGEQDTYDVVKPLFNGSEEVFYIESWQRRRDGKKRLLAWWCRTLKDKDGNVIGALSSAEDITERKQAEKALADSEAELRALLQTSLALTDLNLETTLRTIGNHAKALFAADGCRIFLLEPDGITLRCVLALLENFAAFSELKIRVGEGVTGSVAASGQAEIVNDMFNDPRTVQVPGTPEEDEAIMFAPLKLGEKVIGVMSIRRIGLERPFSPSDLELLKAFASMSASAVSNASSFELTRQRLAELTSIHQAAQTLTELHTPESLAQDIIRILEQTLHYEYAAVLLVAEDDNRLIPFALSEQAKGVDFMAQEKAYIESLDIPPGAGITGWVAQNGQSVRLDDVRQDARYLAARENIRSELCVPLRIGERVIGVVNVETTRPNAYSESDQRILETIAAQIALAIQNANLFEEAQRRISEMGTLHRASQFLLSARLDPDAIYVTLHKAVTGIMPCDAFTIVLEDESGGDYHAVYLYDVDQRYPERRIPRGQGLSGKVISEGQTLFIHDNLQSNAPVVHFGSPKQVRSILAVPLRRDNQIMGMVSAQSYQPNAYGEQHRVLLETLAAQITTVIENARLFEETHQRVVELETLNRVSIALRAITNWDEMLAIVLEESLHALNAAHGSIILWNRESNDLRQTIARGWLSDLAEAPVKPGEGVFGNVFASGETHLSREFASDPLTLEKSRGLLPPGWGGACVPIRSPEQVLGILLLSVPSERELSQNEVRLLCTLAEMTGTALHRMNLHRETTRRAQEFESLYDTSQALSAENELDTLLKTIVEHACDLLDAASSGIYLYDEARGDLEVVMDTSHTMTIGTRLQFGEGMAGRVAQTRQPLRVENYSAWEGRSPKYNGILFRAILEVPMLYGGELIGVLLAYEIGGSKRVFTEADERLLALFASQAAGVIHSARLHRETMQHLDRLQALHVMDQAIAGSLDKHVTLNILLDQIISQLSVDAADVLLLQAPLQTLQFGAGQGFHTGMNESASVRVGESFAGRAVLERRIVRVEDRKTAQENHPFAVLWSSEGFSNYYAVPLIAKGQVKGVLEVFHRTPFTAEPEWLNFLETLANHTAIAVDSAQMFENLQGANMELALAYDATIEGWSRAMDLRDQETEGHTRRVTEMAVTLARAMGIHDEELLHIRRSALLHDIGKIGVPDHILLKAGKLTEQEWEIMRKHPQLAYEMLQPIQYLRASLDIPYCHHEKWDGTGYPQGLKGEQIPLAARIFAIVDVYDAFTSDRPYRKAWTKAKTLKYIREQSGTHFDPRVVEKFMDLWEKKS